MRNYQNLPIFIYIEVFKEPPLTAFKRQRNIRDILIKSKVPPAPNKFPKREARGMTKCGKDCTACPYVKTGQNVKISDTETWKLNKKFSCETYNCVYMLECSKCGNRYIGETSRMLKARLSDHRGYINNKVVNITTGDHFNQPGHSLADLNVLILEQVKKEDEIIERREKDTLSTNSIHFMMA